MKCFGTLLWFTLAGFFLVNCMEEGGDLVDLESVAPGYQVAKGNADPANHRVFTPGSPGIGDPYYPLDGNGGYDVQHYALKLNYDPATGVLGGTAWIYARATQDLSAFNLDLVGMEVEAIRVNGRRAAWLLGPSLGRGAPP